MAVGRNDILELSTELMNCVRKNDIIGARCIVSDITEEEDRKLIVAKRDDCNAPLFEAAQRGDAEIVSFLVKECNAGLEERGVYDKHELITPLLCAAILDKLEVVRCLIDLGADINAVSSCGSTPVLFACEQSSPAVAEYFIRRGADINKPNKSGETCLMKAVKFKELCQFLIDNGADVKAQDENGDLALHHAIFRTDQPDTVQLLLDHGSDPYVKNKAGDDAFRTACLWGKELILQELLFQFKPRVQRWIESYHLLGAYYLDYGDFTDDPDKAIKFWKDAVDIQQKNSFVEIIPSKPNPVYLFAQEVNTVEEWEALSRNRESIHMYALMIRERILGPNHIHTIRRLGHRGESYKQNGEIQRCIDIWKHALQNSHGGQLTNSYFVILHLLFSLFHNLYEECRKLNLNVDQLTGLTLMKDSFEVLEIVTTKLELIMNEHAEKNSKEVVAYFTTMILLITEFITDQHKNANQVDSFRNIVYRLVRCQPRTEHGRTLLHLLVSPSPFFLHSRGYISLTPSIAIIELLLEFGVNVNAVDDEHNTALLMCSKALQEHGKEQRLQDCDLMKNVADLLLKRDAHVDIVNFSGDSAAEILTSSLIGWNMLDFVSLKCFAARAVLKYKIPYVGHIPAPLESFVQMHSTTATNSNLHDVLT